MEPGHYQLVSTSHLDRQGGIQQGDGQQHETTNWIVSLQLLSKPFGDAALGAVVINVLSFFSHIEQVSKNSRIDIEEVTRVRYLYEFDR